MNEKLDTERATTGKLSEGATSVDVRIVPSFIHCSDELYLAVFTAEWRAKKLRHPPDFFHRQLKVSLRVQNSTVPEGRGLIMSSIFRLRNEILVQKSFLALVLWNGIWERFHTLHASGTKHW